MGEGGLRAAGWGGTAGFHSAAPAQRSPHLHHAASLGTPEQRCSPWARGLLAAVWAPAVCSGISLFSAGEVNLILKVQFLVLVFCLHCWFLSVLVLFSIKTAKDLARSFSPGSQAAGGRVCLAEGRRGQAACLGTRGRAGQRTSAQPRGSAHVSPEDTTSRLSLTMAAILR